ncbi:hypothetical protein PVAP13_7KG382810 [Panicum virgatum]|uniref:Uncharacterized protein n=1 Tax=Panicum virgatum TaxID=38727 RepID=A0A8T0QQV5_PANVG|nr:hypothetical protein PVAP13_7KG382810 [Panicum virgatum]
MNRSLFQSRSGQRALARCGFSGERAFHALLYASVLMHSNCLTYCLNKRVHGPPDLFWEMKLLSQSCVAYLEEFSPLNYIYKCVQVSWYMCSDTSMDYLQ